MIVLTIDQESSRVVGDRVDELLAALAAVPAASAPGLVRPFERTVGDEVQAVLDDAPLAVEIVLAVLRRGGWSIGIGSGPVELPLPATSRAGTGEAFFLARAAVERAKSRARAVPLAVGGVNATAAGEAEAVLTLLAAVARRRTPAGWEIIDAFEAAGVGARQDDVAMRLGISQQAVSQRLRTTHWAEELAARPLAARLLVAAGSPASTAPTVATSTAQGGKP